MTPFRLKPRPVARVWGGHRLAQLFGGPASSEPIGERWDVHGSLEAVDGPYAGQTLDELVAAHGADLTGRWATDRTFPLLLKWLDCNDWLSIQVHPDDPTARRLTGDPEARGKNECWYFYEVGKDSELLHGVEGEPPASLEGLDGRDWLALSHRHRPRVGEWLHVPAGTLHALGPGLVLFEVQQSSDLTYRLYDWDRMGLDGQPRPLHLDEGRHCAGGFDLPPTPAPELGPSPVGEPKVRCPFFVVEEGHGAHELPANADTFQIVTCLAGSGSLGGYRLGLADSLIVPAAASSQRLEGGNDFRWARICLAPAQNSER